MSSEWRKLTEMVETLYEKMKTDPTYERAHNSFYAAVGSMRSAASKAAAAERKNVYSDWHTNEISFISPMRGKRMYGFLEVIISSIGVDIIFDMDSVDKIPTEKLSPIFADSWSYGNDPYLGDRIDYAIKSLYARGYLAKRQILDRGGTIKSEYKVTKEGHKAFKGGKRLLRRIKKNPE